MTPGNFFGGMRSLHNPYPAALGVRKLLDDVQVLFHITAFWYCRLYREHNRNQLPGSDDVSGTFLLQQSCTRLELNSKISLPA